MQNDDLIAELAEIRAAMTRLRRREAVIEARLALSEGQGTPLRPGWPIRRVVVSGEPQVC